jgi:hypothetical protein
MKIDRNSLWETTNSIQDISRRFCRYRPSLTKTPNLPTKQGILEDYFKERMHNICKQKPPSANYGKNSADMLTMRGEWRTTKISSPFWVKKSKG